MWQYELPKANPSPVGDTIGNVPFTIIDGKKLVSLILEVSLTPRDWFVC